MRRPKYMQKKRWSSKDERGVAIFIALFALLLMSAIAAGMMFMSNTETKINFNYRDAQSSYFASEGGLEEARERLRNTGLASAVTPPLAMPDLANQTGVLYIVNPRSTETVAPWDSANPYFDDELCHENFSGLALTNAGANTPCSAAPSGATWYTSYTSIEPYVST